MKHLVVSSFLLTFVVFTIVQAHSKGGRKRLASEIKEWLKELEDVDEVERKNDKAYEKADCAGTTFLRSEGDSITSPGYPSRYGAHLNCGWVIYAPARKNIKIEFNGIFDIEGQHGNCLYDVLDIYDGNKTSDPLLLRTCGHGPDESILTTGSQAYILFTTDQMTSGQGFSLTYTFVDDPGSGTAERVAQCSGIKPLIASTGSVTSPGYPDQNYTDNTNCGFRITAPTGQMVKITFNGIAIEPEPSCLYDSLSVYDGSKADDSMLGSFCGKDTPEAITSTGNQILVQFVSDGSINDRGFSFSWEFVSPGVNVKESPSCGSKKPQVIEKEMGTFSSQGFDDGKNYGDNLDCAWRVVVPTTMRAHLKVVDFAVEDANLCRYDKLSIYDGHDDKAKLMGPYCGTTSPGDITGSSNVLYVVFKSDESINYKGFKAQFSGKLKKKEIPSTGSGSAGTGAVACGVPAIEPKFARIVGGQAAVPHSWPWQISIRVRNHPNTDGWGHWCGGSVIHNNWILTAAHCLTKYPHAELYRVIAGDHNRVENSDRSQVTVNVKRFIMHENYDASSYDNDIALLELENPLTYSSEVSPVCLPTSDILERTVCVTTGWGATQGTADNTFLQQVQVPILSRTDCNRAGWYGGKITPNMLCAGYPEGRKDSCQGDSGGPLVCITGGSWIVYGATSWGHRCAVAKKPGVYTRINMFTDWVENKTGVQFNN